MKKPQREPDGDGMRFIGEPELIESLPSGSKIFAQKVEFDLSDRPKRAVTDRDEAYKAILERTRLLLKPMGFRKRGPNFVRNRGISTQLVSFGKSQWNTKQDPINFSVSLHFFLHELDRAVDPDRPGIDDYKFRFGLGFLYQKTQGSWELHGSEDVEQVWQDLGTAIRDYGCPALDAATTEEGLVSLAGTNQAAIMVEFRRWLESRGVPRQ